MAMYPAIARRLLEETLDEGNLEVVDQIMPADAIVHALLYRPTDPSGVDAEVLSGRELLKAVISAQRQIVPDLRVEIDTFLNAGHTITALCTLSGTGEDGARASWNMVAILHFHDAKVVELWLIADRLGMYQQLGLIPEEIDRRVPAGV